MPPLPIKHIFTSKYPPSTSRYKYCTVVCTIILVAYSSRNIIFSLLLKMLEENLLILQSNKSQYLPARDVCGAATDLFKFSIICFSGILCFKIYVLLQTLHVHLLRMQKIKTNTNHYQCVNWSLFPLNGLVFTLCSNSLCRCSMSF